MNKANEYIPPLILFLLLTGLISLGRRLIEPETPQLIFIALACGLTVYIYAKYFQRPPTDKTN